MNELLTRPCQCGLLICTRNRLRAIRDTAAASPDFRAALESHLGETHAQIARLEEVAHLLEATLTEAKAADETLSALADGGFNQEAMVVEGGAAAEDEQPDGLFRFEPDFAAPTPFEPRPATAPTAFWSVFLSDFLLKPAQRRRVWLVPFDFLSRPSPRWKPR